MYIYTYLNIHIYFYVSCYIYTYIYIYTDRYDYIYITCIYTFVQHRPTHILETMHGPLGARRIPACGLEY